MFTNQNERKPFNKAKQRHMFYFFLTFAMVITMTFASPDVRAEDDWDEIPFDKADIYLELNDTDGDLGIHALIDGEPWKRLEIHSPDENRLLNIRANGLMRRHGLTELFFESAEPSFDELLPEAFFNRFPEGEYEIEGITIEGDDVESTAVLTHLLPAPPENILVSGVPIVEDCEEQSPPLVSVPVIISWDPVTMSHPELGRIGEPVDVVKYQVVVEREEPESLIYSVDLPPSVTEIEVPEGFTDLGEEFKLEILVREASGNQTAVESCFIVER